MAAKSFRVKMSSIAKEIDKATKQLERIHKKLEPKERKKAALHLKKLASARSLVAATCHAMTASYGG
jgi:predicted DNA-binding protein YlxM (UPF0122 family)